MSTYILDTETTGISKSDQVIELAYLPCLQLEAELFTINDPELYIKDALAETYTERFLPSCPINQHAHAVHGINRTDLIGKKSSQNIDLPDNIKYIVGHGVSFDKRLLAQSNTTLVNKLDDVRYICTLELARTISKNFKIEYDNHKLDTLVNHYYPDHAHKLVTPLHSASGDVVKNLLVLLKLVEHLRGVKTWDDLYDLQQDIKKVRR